MLNVDFYRPIVEFLALYMGSNTEVILCDTENILLIENSMDEERFEGAPIGEMQQALIQNPECRNIPYNINYRTLSKTGEKLAVQQRYSSVMPMVLLRGCLRSTSVLVSLYACAI